MTKITDLTDQQLCHLCATAQGWRVHNKAYVTDSLEMGNLLIDHYDPINNWQQAGELVEKYGLWLVKRYTGLWDCGNESDREIDCIRIKADTPQRAICLAVVASVYGDEVEESEQSEQEMVEEELNRNARSYNIGKSDYAQHRIQPWDVWAEYKLDPWRADIIKRVLRNKPGERELDLKKIIHICTWLLENEK